VRDRWGAHESDIDAYSTLTLRLRPTSGLELYLSGDLAADLHDDRDRPEVLTDLWATWDHSVQGRLQEAYVRLTGVPDLDLRLGRQLQVLGRTVQFDGVSADWAATKVVRLRALGGVPVYFYESSRRGDLLGGAAVDVTPTAWTRLSLEYLHVAEERRGDHRRDDLFALSGSQVVGGVVQVRARGEVLDDEVRSGEAGLTLNLSDLGVQVNARYYVLLKPQALNTTGLDPFTDFLEPERPHQLVSVSASKTLGEHVVVEVFYAWRDVTHHGDADLSNHDFHRYGATLSLHDVLTEGLGCSVTAERWDVTSRGGSDTQQVSGEVSYRPGDVLRLSVGSSYQLYRWDVAGRARERVRVWFARVRLLLGDHTIDGTYSYERDDLGDFHAARVGYRHDF
jgi:hypothetical protein